MAYSPSRLYHARDEKVFSDEYSVRLILDIHPSTRRTSISRISSTGSYGALDQQSVDSNSQGCGSNVKDTSVLLENARKSSQCDSTVLHGYVFVPYSTVILPVPDRDSSSVNLIQGHLKGQMRSFLQASRCLS